MKFNLSADVVAARVHGEDSAKVAAAKLVEWGVWFVLEPWPDDEWLVMVKTDRADLLEELQGEIAADD